MSLSKQEMFDRAYRGLASQGWRRAFRSGCVYQTGDGRRCAWGWVDTSLGRDVYGGVESLRFKGIGIAAELDTDHAVFACALQGAHDGTCDDMLRASMEAFAARHNLTIPVLS